MNADVQIGISADKQEEPTEHKVAYKQDNSNSNMQSVNHENKKEDKQSISLPDLGLSSALGLFTPDIGKEEEQQTPVKKKKKKPKKGRSM